jgi:hypothetical protein
MSGEKSKEPAGRRRYGSAVSAGNEVRGLGRFKDRCRAECMARTIVPRVTCGTGVIFTSHLPADACATERQHRQTGGRCVDGTDVWRQAGGLLEGGLVCA